MEQATIDKYKVKEGEEVTPIIVLTGTAVEHERFCMLTGRNSETAIPIRQGFQIPLYPHLEIVTYADFWLNAAYDSPEFHDRMFKAKMQAHEERFKAILEEKSLPVEEVKEQD